MRSWWGVVGGSGRACPTPRRAASGRVGGELRVRRARAVGAVVVAESVRSPQDRGDRGRRGERDPAAARPREACVGDARGSPRRRRGREGGDVDAGVGADVREDPVVISGSMSSGRVRRPDVRAGEARPRDGSERCRARRRSVEQELSEEQQPLAQRRQGGRMNSVWWRAPGRERDRRGMLVATGELAPQPHRASARRAGSPGGGAGAGGVEATARFAGRSRPNLRGRAALFVVDQSFLGVLVGESFDGFASSSKRPCWRSLANVVL